MSSNSNWINPPIGLIDTNQNGKVIMNWSQANTIFNAIIDPPFASIVSGGDFNKWVSRFMWLPFQLKGVGDNEYTTILGGVTYKDVLNSGMVSAEDEKGYYIGEIKVEEFTSFKDFDPYSKYKLWLPYYGFIELKASEISNKYIEVLLYIDLNTGQSQYVVGVSNTHIEVTNAPYLLYNQSAFKDIVIIGTYTLDLGYDIPLGSVGMADTIRNITLSTIKMGGNLALGLSSSIGVSGSNVQAMDKSISYGDATIKRGFNESLGVLNSFQLSPQFDKINNGILNTSTSRSLIFVKYSTRITQDMTDIKYRKLYGLPCNKILNLNEVYGYTEVDELFLEDKSFGNATSDEKKMLRQLFASGVIFPDRILSITTNLVNCVSSELNPTSIKYEEGIATLTFTPDDGYEFGTSPLTSLVGCDIVNQLIESNSYTLTINNAIESVVIQVNAIEIKEESTE